MKKNILATVKPKLIATTAWARRYYRIIGIVLIAILYGGLVVQINLLNRREPSDDAVTEKLQTIKRPKIDQQTTDKLQQLQDNSNAVQALFKSARDNPFQE